MHWWRSIAACRAQTCWVYLSLVFFLTWRSTAQHWRGTKTFWQRCITCTSSEGRARCPEQCLGWWRESFLKCTDWRSLGRRGLAGSPPLGQAPQCLWLLGLPSSLVHLRHGLPGLLRQPRRVRQDRGGPAQVPEGVQHHYKKKAGKHQEKPLVWLIFLLQKRTPLDSYKCKLNICWMAWGKELSSDVQTEGHSKAEYKSQRSSLVTRQVTLPNALQLEPSFWNLNVVKDCLNSGIFNNFFSVFIVRRGSYFFTELTKRKRKSHSASCAFFVILWLLRNAIILYFLWSGRAAGWNFTYLASE